MGVPVHIAPDEVPEVDDPTIKLLTVARRLGLRIGTCSSAVVDEADRWELAVVDLRGVAQALTPDHLPGERLRIDLIKEGRQPRQAIGYLPDGDMVVVNDATHLIGRGPTGHRALHPAHHPGRHGVRQAVRRQRNRRRGADQTGLNLTRGRSGRIEGRRSGDHASFTAATSLVSVSLASPNSRVVFASKSSSLSMPANPGRIERLRNTMFSASSALMMGMP